MDKNYNAEEIESRISSEWEKSGYGAPSGTGSPYSMVLPPPNVTGSLHMGHGFQMTLMDILIRYQRASGKNTLWQVGTDHAGIATQMVVERQLAAKGIKRTDLGRKGFIDKVWQWQKQSGGTITKQMRRLGVSPDWSRECFSLDPHISEAVYTTFNKLYEDGLLYRGYRLVNWDPVLQTAISDLEVVSKNESGSMWHMRYPLSGQENHIVVATTRPETLFGDVAVAVHPEDERYKDLVGSKIKLPLTDREIPIITDEMVDMEFGSGCVKITPGHDFNDYEVGKRHNLPLISILNKQAQINENAPEQYRGLDRFDARKKVIADLEAINLIEKIEDHKLTLPYGDRSDTIIEPLSTEQWFIDMKPLTKKAIEALDNGELKFYPDNWKNTYLRWLDDIQDWCVSRQLWWGHSIPAWYDAEKNIYIGRNEKEVRARYKLNDDIELTADPDVLDTWFSAALWPFATMGWPEKTAAFETFYPTQTLITGFDIIFFWVARMVMLGYYCTGKSPFKEVYITGLIRDNQGQKMSKSKGNVLDPIDLIDGIDLESLVTKRTGNMMQPKKAKQIEKSTRKQFADGIPSFGTDALRFTFCALASTGRDINFELERITGYRNFCNKLWNASRYVFMQTEQQTIAKENDSSNYTLAEHWILDKLHNLTKQCHKHIAQYRFDLLAQELYEFIWNQYCDWYLELSKVNLLSENINEQTKQQVRLVLLQVLESCLRLLHPITPYITEEIWQNAAKIMHMNGDSIMLQPYPLADDYATNTRNATDMEIIKQIINATRNIRGEINISPKQQVNMLIKCNNEELATRIETNKDYLQTLAKIEDLKWIKDDATPSDAAMAALENMTIYIPLEGLIDHEQEKLRLQKILDKIEKDLAQCQRKLDNESYLAKAPANVVEQEKQKHAELSSKRSRTKEQLNSVLKKI